MTAFAFSIQKPEIGLLQLLLCLKKFAGRLLHVNTGNALRCFDVAVCSHSFNLYLFQNKNNTLLGHQHRETVTFPLIASCSLFVASYLGTTVAQNSGWATQLLQTSSSREKQHFSFLSWLSSLSYICLPLPSSQAGQSSKANRHHSPSALCCSPEEASDERGRVGVLNSSHPPCRRHSLTRPVNGLFQTSSVLTQLSHAQAKSLSQLHSTLLKSFCGGTKWKTVCGEAHL